MKIISSQFLAILGAALLLTACTNNTGTGTPVPTADVPIIVPTATATALPVGNDTPWAELGLTGHLLYSLGVQGIHYLDLATAEEKVVFTLPEDAWLTAASLSPDGSSIVLSYAPPPEAGAVQLGYTAIYELPGDCLTRDTSCTPDDLTPLIERVDDHEAYFSPLWSPDGQYVYFAHFTPSTTEENAASPFTYTMERLPMSGGTASGEREVILQDALWPALSPDGKTLVYVYQDPATYTNQLYISNADGSDARPLTNPKDFDAVDAPLFTRDSQNVIFSAVGDGPSAAALRQQTAWIDLLTGMRTAEAAPLAGPMAHNVPSDWWSIPINGGAPTRLSTVFDTGMFGDLSPDGQYMAYISASGLYALPVAGGKPEKLLDVSGFGTLEWAP